VESLEPIFHQDLNGDGTIGVPSPVVLASAGLSNAAQPQSTASAASENFHFSGTNVSPSPAAAAANQPGGNSAPMAGTHDNFTFASNSGQVSIANFTPATDSIASSRSVFASHDTLAATIHNAGVAGNAIINDAAHEATTTLQLVTTAQLLAHLTDFHIV
jgi:hypothetical protein